MDELDGVPDGLVEFKVEGVQPTAVADALQIKLLDRHGLDLVIDPATEAVTGYYGRDFKVRVGREQLIAQMLHAGALVKLLNFNPVLERQGLRAVGEDVHVGQAGVATTVAVVGRVEREVPFKHAIQAVEPAVFAEGFGKLERQLGHQLEHGLVVRPVTEAGRGVGHFGKGPMVPPSFRPALRVLPRDPVHARPLRAGLPADGEGVEMALAVKGGQVFADARLNLVVVVAGRADVFVPTGLEAVLLKAVTVIKAAPAVGKPTGQLAGGGQAGPLNVALLALHPFGFVPAGLEAREHCP